MNTLYFLHAFLSAACAVVYADVLVQPGMLLAPVQRLVRGLHLWAWVTYSKSSLDAGTLEEWQTAYYDGHDLDSQWWWKPLWGCATCVCGQLAFWSFWFLYWPGEPRLLSLYDWLCLCGWCAGYASCAILFSLFLQKAVAWTRN